MKQVYKCVLWIMLVGVCVDVSAQRFTSSVTSQAIQVEAYQASGLYLQSDARLSHGAHSGSAARVGAGYTAAHSTATMGATATYATPQVQVKRSTFGVGAWQGNVPDLSGNLAAGDRGPVRRAPGGGNVPGNVTHVPVGNMPVWLLLLLLGAYAVRCSRKARKA